MNGRRTRLLRVALIVGILALGVAGTWFGVHAAQRARAGRAFAEQLAQIDAQLAGGYSAKAESGLLPAASLAQSERNWLELLKRATALGRQTGKYGTLLRIADQARGRIPGSRKLGLLARYARLRAGGPAAAAMNSAETAGADLDLQYLQAEEWERRALPAPPGSGLAPELQQLLDLEKRLDPQHLGRLAARWQDERFQLAAGLRWLAVGDARQAWQTLRSLPDNASWRELKALAAYDAGEDSLALEQLEALPQKDTRPDLLLLRADLLRLLERDAEAAAMYRQAIASDPRYFWSPYLNLARIAGSSGEPEGAASLYRKAFELFPESEPPAIAYAENLRAAGEPERAAEVLTALLRRNPASLEARWLLLDLQRDGPPRRLARLQQLFAEDPQNASLCRVLALGLLALGDGRGAEDMLNRYTGGAGEAWLGELRGIAAAVRGDLAEAEEWLQGSLRARADGRVRYNLAMVQVASGRVQEAIQELLRAAEELSAAAALSGNRSPEAHVRARLAELFLRTGNRAAARRESTFALELDPASGRALLVLRMLEAE